MLRKSNFIKKVAFVGIRAVRVRCAIERITTAYGAVAFRKIIGKTQMET